MSQHRPSSTPRRDIQGLRAFAVLVVFLDHLFGWPSGGFAGVDIFFVISGFLITGLLLKQYERTHTISFARFYANRAKRILPAATLTLVITVALSHWFLSDRRAGAITIDALWALLFGANWRFGATGTDYFEQGGAVSPLQHYWSLSVEEQFYFVWPWLLLGLLLLLARRGEVGPRRTRLVAGASISVLIIASLLWAALQSAAEPTTAYFSTFTRAWELGAGALLAVVSPFFVRMAPGARVILLHIGIAAMASSLFVINPTTVWPWPGALLPVLGAVAFIASGIGEEARYNPIFTNRGAVFIGDISYSLYLWHFPVIVLGPALFPGEGLISDAVVFGVGLSIAIVAYYAVERPLHKMPLWTDDTSVTAWSGWRRRFRPSVRLAGVGALAVTTVVVTGLAFGPMSGTVSAVPAVPTGEQAAEDATGASELQQQLTERISESVSAGEWPEGIEADMDLAGGLPQEVKSCADPDGYDESGCTWGSGDQVAYVVGDSVANAYVPMYREMLLPKGWQVRQLTLNGCEFNTLNLSSERAAPLCEDRVTSAISMINKDKPDVVFVTSQWTGHTKAGGKDSATVGEWWTGAKEALDQIEVPTIYVAPPPGGTSVDACYSSTTPPAACASAVSETWSQSRAHLDTYAQDSARVDLVDTAPWFCHAGVCPAFVGESLTRSDTVHPTQAYLGDLGEVAEEAVVPLLPSS